MKELLLDFQNSTKKAKILLIGIFCAIILTLGTLTFAFFSASSVSGNTATDNVLVITSNYGEVIVRYDGGKNSLSSNNMLLVEGGDHLYDYIKYSVEYTGNVPQDTYMYFKDVTNTFCQYANITTQTCTNDEEDTYVGDEYSYTTYYCDNETKYNNIESATDTDLSSCTVISTEHTPMPITGENKYLSTTTPITFNNASTKYYVIVARLENKDIEQNYNQGKTFTGKVYVDINSIGYEVPFGTNILTFSSPDSLAYKMLSDQNVAKSTATPTISKAAVTQEYITANSLSLDNYVVENGIYQTEDDNGISYFYRGHVTRNYVKFAGFIWRIVRINGDGSIRIILDGFTSTVKKNDPANTLCTTGCAGSNVPYNTSSNWDTGTGPSNAVAEETTALEYASYDNGNLEGAMNTFYETYIYNEANSIDYQDYLTDSTFCSDTSWGTKPDHWYFSPRTRLTSGTSSLECETNSRYKVADGTGKLTYPIATLSADEINYAGASGGSYYWNYNNQNYYLYNNITTNANWWTMSPYYWRSFGYVDAFFVLSDGIFGSNFVAVSYGSRPVVNLKADTLVSGNGTIIDPYIPTLNPSSISAEITSVISNLKVDNVLVPNFIDDTFNYIVDAIDSESIITFDEETGYDSHTLNYDSINNKWTLSIIDNAGDTWDYVIQGIINTLNGWTVHNATNATISTEILDGYNTIKFLDTNTSAIAYMEKGITPTASTWSISFDFKFTDESASTYNNKFFRVFLNDGPQISVSDKTNTFAETYIQRNGTNNNLIVSSTGTSGTAVNSSRTFSLGEWHNYRIEVNESANNYDIYVDDTIVFNDVGYRYDIDDINCVVIGSGNAHKNLVNIKDFQFNE